MLLVNKTLLSILPRKPSVDSDLSLSPYAAVPRHSPHAQCMMGEVVVMNKAFHLVKILKSAASHGSRGITSPLTTWELVSQICI